MVHRGPPLTILRTLASRRVSTAEQEKGRASLDARNEAVAAYCRVHGLPETSTPPRLGRTGERRRAERAHAERGALAAGNVRATNMVIVRDGAQFSRDFVFTVERVREMLRKDTVFVSMKQRFDSHTSNAENTRKQGDPNGT